MVKAKFNGDADNANYQCAEFNARRNDTVTMPNTRWAVIISEGKKDLFTVLSQDDEKFPEQKTIG